MALKIAVLDDYAHAALRVADWSSLDDAEITVFHDTLKDDAALVQRLQGFDVVCLMRERTPLPAGVIDCLTDLKLIVTTGPRNLSIDLEAASARNIIVCGTQSRKTSTAELAMLLMLTLSRRLHTEVSAMQQQGWQQNLGRDLHGLHLGLIGLGNIGQQMATLAKAFGMHVHAWSPNIDAALCRKLEIDCEPGLASLMGNADIVSMHMVLSDRTRHLVDAAAFSAMREHAVFINTSRGPLADEQALLEGLRAGRPWQAALDVYTEEPLPMDSPLRDHDLIQIGRLLLSPHLGYVTEQTWKLFYTQTVEAINAWLQDNPVRLLN
jgi:phosphoglycerate dehydrogenase-like enzyme